MTLPPLRKFSENSSNLVQVYAPYLHEGQGCRKVLILYTRLEHLLLISTISTFLSENTNTLMTEEEATGFVGKENIGTQNELVQSITSCDSQPFYLNTTCLAPVNHHDFGLNHMGWSGVVTVLQIKKILQTLREDIRRKKTFSFGHCPNVGGGLPMLEFFGPFFHHVFPYILTSISCYLILLGHF